MAIIVIGAVGMLLRIHYVLTNSLWTDEITSLHQITVPWSDFARWYEAPDPHPPLYYLSLRLFGVVVPGTASETTTRLAGTAWFLVVPVSLFVYGRRRSTRRLPALGVLALVAVTPPFVYLGAELRMYGMVIGLVVLMTLLGIDWLERERAPLGHVVGFAALGAGLSLTHYTGAVVALALGGAILAVRLVRDCRIDWGVPASGALALLLMVPIIGILREQFAFISGTLYDTPATELRGFLLWATVGPGLVVFAVAVGVAGTALVSPRRRRPVGDRVREPSFVLPVTTLLLVILAFTASSVLFDIDLHNFGISIVPPTLLVLAGGSIAAEAPRLLVAGLVIAMVMAIGVTLVTNRDSSVFEPNRVATVDTLDDALRATGLDAESDELVIVHVDWDRSNAYFAERVLDLYPAADVTLIPIRDYQTLGRLLDSRIGTGKAVLVVTRLPLETRILWQVPANAVVSVLDDNSVLVEREH